MKHQRGVLLNITASTEGVGNTTYSAEGVCNTLHTKGLRNNTASIEGGVEHHSLYRERETPHALQRGVRKITAQQVRLWDTTASTEGCVEHHSLSREDEDVEHHRLYRGECGTPMAFKEGVWNTYGL